MFCATVCNGNFVAFNTIISTEVMYINVPGFPSAQLLPVFSSFFHYDYPEKNFSAECHILVLS